MKKQILDECDYDFIKGKVFKERKYNYNLTCKYRVEEERGSFFYILNSPLFYDLGSQAFSYTQEILGNYLKNCFKKLNVTRYAKVFIVGLGNPRLSADALGERVFEKVLKTGDILSKYNNLRFTQGIATNIYANTGIDTDRLIKAVVDKEKPDLVIVIDSLATSNIERLGMSFQLTNTSLQPGGALNSNNKILSKEMLGVETLFIGVPFIYKYEKENKVYYLSSKDTDYNVKICANVIANSLNSQLFPSLKKSEIEDLIFNI